MRPAPRITARSLAVGVALTAALGYLAPYSAHVRHASYLALDFSTPGATALLFVLAALVNPLLRRLRPTWALAPAELVVVFIMLAIGSAVVEMGLASQLLPIVATPAYYGTPQNHWHELFTERLPAGVVLRDAHAAARFFEGAAQGRIDWAPWLPVFVAWAPLLGALYAVMIALMVLARRQWADRERLAYPLTQVPLAVIDPRARLLANPRLWVGFGLAFSFALLRGLHWYFPPVPKAETFWPIPVWGQDATLLVRISFPMLGFFFLVNQDVAFSLWCFNLLFWLARALMLRWGYEFNVNLGGYGTAFALYRYLGWGAMAALVIGMVWSARDHLRDVLRHAVGNAVGCAAPRADAGEALSYRAAALTALVGLVVMQAWLVWTGLPWGVAAFFLAMAFLFFLGLTRAVVESGLAEAVAPLIAPGSVVAAWGSLSLGSRGHAALALTYVYTSDIRTFVMASAATSLDLSANVGLRGRGVCGVMVLGLVTALVSSIWATLAMAYRYGGATMNSWFFIAGPKIPFEWLSQLLTQPQEVNRFGLSIGLAGAVVMALLMVARQTCWWWPLHPVGWAIGSVWIMDQLWFSCFLAWLLKTAVIRAGGLRLYRQGRAVAIGLILGQYTANLTWLAIDHLTGAVGNGIFWI